MEGEPASNDFTKIQDTFYKDFIKIHE